MNTSQGRLVAIVIAMLAVATLPFWAADPSKIYLATLVAAYWVLIAGLNLVVGYTGLISIGHVGLLAIGSYTFAILVGQHGVNPAIGLLIVGAVGGLWGLMLGLPSLRLPGFYFAMATMAFSIIVSEFLVAQNTLTGGGAGIPVPGFDAPFNTPNGLFWLVAIIASIVTWLTWNIARLMWGRAMIALRDNELAAASVGVPVFAIKLTVYTFSGITASLAGALFGSLQSYVTPETFHFELGLFFFICIVIGGRGAILGPLFGTIVLTALPELVASLAKFSHFFYGVLLLVVVLLLPEGLGNLFAMLREKIRPRQLQKHVVAPDLVRLSLAIQ